MGVNRKNKRIIANELAKELAIIALADKRLVVQNGDLNLDDDAKTWYGAITMPSKYSMYFEYDNPLNSGATVAFGNLFDKADGFQFVADKERDTITLTFFVRDVD